MISVAHNADQVRSAFRNMARDFPAEIGQALSTVGVWARGALRKRLESGAGLVPLSAVTMQFREYRARKPKAAAAFWSKQIRISAKAGHEKTSARMRKMRGFRKAAASRARRVDTGKLGGHLAPTIEYTKAKNAALVGWMRQLVPYSDKFQTFDSHALSKDERRIRHIMGIEDMTYRRPARPILRDFALDPRTRSEFLRIASGRVRSIIEKRARGVRPARGAAS
jgi:hypothetical protein